MTSVLHRPVLLSLLLASCFVLVNLAGTEVPGRDDEGVPYVDLYAEPGTAAEVLVNQGDGQAFAALAQDPTLERPDVFLGGAPEAAYRAQRPLLGWLAWISSAGQAAAVPLVLFAWAVVGTAVLVEAVRRLAVDRGRVSSLAALAVALPGALVDLDWTGPESLGTGIALLGVCRWARRDDFAAAALLVAAALARETLLLVPLALALSTLWQSRGWNRRVLLLAASPAALAAWWVVLRLRLGSWPTEAGDGRLGLPLRGMIAGAERWGLADVGFVAFAVILLVLAAARFRQAVRRDDQLVWVVGVHLAFMVVMGDDVWKRWEDFGRPLLPLYASLLVLALPLRSERTCVPPLAPEAPLASPRGRQPRGSGRSGAQPQGH